MILFLIIPVAALVYYFFAVIHYYYWKHYFHEHNFCVHKTHYRYDGSAQVTCECGCEMGAWACSIIWPVWPFVFLLGKYVYQLPRATYLAGKSIGTKLTKVGK